MAVWGTTTAWPDLVVAAILASLFINSSWQILKLALNEYETDQSA